MRMVGREPVPVKLMSLARAIQDVDDERLAVLAFIEQREVAEREMDRRARAMDEADVVERLARGWRW